MTAHRRLGRERGEGYGLCETNKDYIAGLLKEEGRLSKVSRLLLRNNVAVSDATLRRFAMDEMQWGQRKTTIRVDDGNPGEELQADTGRMLLLEPHALGKRRVVKAFVFTPNMSRYRFIYPCFTETTVYLTTVPFLSDCASNRKRTRCSCRAL